MRKYVLIPDSFKGTMSSLDVCRIVTDAILSQEPDAVVCAIPVADGGEGTVDCFIEAMGASPVTVEVTAGDVNPARITLTQYLIYLPAGSSYAPLDYVSSVNGGDSKNGVTADSAVNTQVPGVYEVVFSYRSGNTESHTRQIVVVE